MKMTWRPSKLKRKIRMFFLSFAVGIGAFAVSAAERGDTLVYLSFDDTVDSVGASASTTIHSGTPAYATERPFTNVYWRMDGGTQQSRSNAKSLYANKSQIQLKLPKTAFSDVFRPDLPSATIEFFIKGVSVSAGSWAVPVRLTHTPSATTTPPFPFMLQTSASDTIELRLDSFEDASSAASSASGREVVTYHSGKVFADSTWHHIAVTVTPNGESASTYNYYYDYQLVSTMTASKFAWNGLTDTMTIDFGSPAATFYLDEFRISKGVLTPGEFLRESPVPQDGDTVFHLTFDGDMSVEGRSLERLTVTANTPAFATTGLPGATIYSRNGDEVSARANTGALFCDHRTITLAWPDTTLSDLKRPNLSSATVEFYIKGDTTTPPAWCLPIYLYNTGHKDQLPYPLLAQCTDAGKMSVRLDCSTDAFTPTSDPKVDVKMLENTHDYLIADGQWHHLAVTIEPLGETGSKMSFYCDHKWVSTQTSTDYSWSGLADFHRLDLGVSSISCWIDEFRITKGVLKPSEFLNTGASPAPREELVYLSFDGNLTSTGRADCQPTLTGGTAQYASRGFSPRVVTTFGGNTNEHANGGSLYVDNNVTLQLPDVPWIARPDLDSATIEFYLKGSADMQRDWQCPVKFKHNEGNAAQPFPLLTQTSATGILYAMLQTYDFTASTIWSISDYESCSCYDLFAMYDAKWHHVAITVEPATGGMSTFTWYVDGEQRARMTSERFGWKGLTGMRKILFEGSPSFTYWVDELRITRGVLAPSEFVKKAPSGVVVIFR